MKKQILLYLAAALTAHGSIVSWNYDAFGTIPTNGTAVAGVVPAANWSNSWPSNPTTNLIDKDGQATTLDIAPASANGNYRIQGSHPGLDGDGTYNKELLNGYLNAGGTTGTSSVAISQIPYAHYDLIVYFSSDVAGRTGTVTDGTTTYDFATIGAPSIQSSNAVLTRTTSTTGANPPANYAKFSGLSGASKTVTVKIPQFGGIAGFQVVANLGTVPEFALQPANQSASVSSSATFTASAAADPAPTYQWEYSANGTTGWAALDGQTSTSLTLGGLTFDEEGYYRVVATNSNGSVTSDTAFLDVIYAPPRIVSQPADAYAVEGSGVQLSVLAGGYETLTYQWYKDGSPLSGEISDKLDLSNVDSEKAGVYFVEVTDSVEEGLVTTSDNATVFTFAAWNGLVSHDAFDIAAGYAVGELPLQAPSITGYNGAWTGINFGGAEPEVMTGPLSYPDPLYLGSSGGHVGKAADTAGIVAANSGRAYRSLAPALVVAANTTGTRYLSWLYRNGNENAAANSTTHSTLALYHNTGGAAPSGDAAQRTFEAGISDSDFGSTNFGFRYYDSQVGDLGKPMDSNVHLLVVKFDLSAADGSDSITVWIDPVLGTGEPTGGTTLTGVDVAFESLAFSDYASNSMAWDELRWGSSFDGVTLNSNPASNFAAWIAGYPGVGGLSGFNDDPDHDGIPNGLENVFGSNPTSSNPGISNISRSVNALTFQHPQNAGMASDVTAVSVWSTDLAQWHESGATSGGVMVGFSSAPNNPTTGITTVTGAISGTVPAKLFVRMKAVLAAP